MEVDFLSNVLYLHKENNWRDLLRIKKSVCDEVSRKLLWVWPSECHLRLIKNAVEKFGLRGVTSIGCGCGLFEWILQQYSDLPIIGYEINKEWWTSRYSEPHFIKLDFPNFPVRPHILNPEYALLFCYFNDGTAFKEYIANYRGHLVFIIGPGPGAGRHTDPAPFNPDFGDCDWILYKTREVRDTKDFVAAYIRNAK